MKTDEKRNHAPDNMEEKILQEAGKLFVEKGYSGVSTTEIARSAGCNQALVHYYFRTKDNLFNRVFEQKAKYVLSEIVSVEAGDGSFCDKLSRMIGIHFDIIRQNSALVLFIVNEITRDPSRLVQIKNALGDLPLTAFNFLSRELDEEKTRGRIRQVELMDLIIDIVSLNAFTFISRPVLAGIWKVGDERLEAFLDHRRQEIIDMVLFSLRPEK